MLPTWASLLSGAVAFALSPVPLIELILVLLSHRRTVNTIVFVGAVVTLTGAGVAIGAAGRQFVGEEGETGTGTVVVLLLLGLALLALGGQNWRNRADTSEPAVLATIARMGPAAVGFLAFGATVVNPKNLVVLVAAGQTVATEFSGTASMVAAGVFVLVATLPYTGAAVYALAGGATARDRLDRLRAWLITHNRLIMGVVATLIGLLLTGRSLATLLA